MFQIPIALSRAAFSPREVARAADLWRVFQDLAVEGSTHAGYPPARYVDGRVSFIVRRMVCVHYRETRHGELLTGATWPSDFKRGMFFRRECRLRAEDGAIASVTQDWVHVTAALKLARASESLVASFAIEVHEPSVVMPTFEPIEGQLEACIEFECWQTWMDPLGHVNHPRYVDWAEEGLARVLAASGLDPVAIVPVAESAFFKAGVRAGQVVQVTTRLVGQTQVGSAVFAHVMSVGDQTVARLTTIRELVDEGPGALVRALRRPIP